MGPHYGIIDGSLKFKAAETNPLILKVNEVVLYNYWKKHGEQESVGEVLMVSWRALNVVMTEHKIDTMEQRDNRVIIPEENFMIGNIDVNIRKRIEIVLTNNDTKVHYFLKCIFHYVHAKPQVKLTTNYGEKIEILPKYSIILNFETDPCVIGYSEEQVDFQFEDFTIGRMFRMNVTEDESNLLYATTEPYRKEEHLLVQAQIEKLKNWQKYIHGRKKEMNTGQPVSHVMLPDCEMPLIIQNFHLDTIELLKGHQLPSELKFLRTLNSKLYTKKLRYLVYFEELATDLSYQSLNLNETIMKKEFEYLALEINDIHHRRIKLQYGDTVRVKFLKEESSHIYEGCIHEIHNNKLLLQFSEDFHEIYKKQVVCVMFQCSRAHFLNLHAAIEKAFSSFGSEYLFPSRVAIKSNQLEIDDEESSHYNVKKIKWFNENLNNFQKTAVINILKGNARPLPYVIIGPPGTGKTITLVEVIMQLYTLLPGSRILVATPSNTSADLLLQRLVSTGKFEPNNIVRVLGYNYMTDVNIPQNLKPFCATLNHQRIVIGTCAKIGFLKRMGYGPGYYTHAFVDEAGQINEPEVMNPLSLLNKNGQVVLCGDPLQLGPVVMSRIALKYGLGISFMERLLGCLPYKPNVNQMNNDGYDHKLVTKLVYSYRAIPKVMKMTNELFYNNTLISAMDMSQQWVTSYIEKLNRVFDSECYSGISFHGVWGTQLRMKDNPSSFNHDEATMVVMFVQKLYDNGIESGDIGIVSPYAAQVVYIKNLIEKRNIPVPMIGSVEHFQGQERKIIIMSTVRSSGENPQVGSNCNISFISDRKRVNVATSRSQFLLMIFGNPQVLLTHPLWKSILHNAILNQGYSGHTVFKKISH